MKQVSDQTKQLVIDILKHRSKYDAETILEACQIVMGIQIQVLALDSQDALIAVDGVKRDLTWMVLELYTGGNA